MAPIDSPELAGFVARLADINALADAAPGFIWRLQTQDGDATALRPFDDERIIVNMSVWEGLAELRDFVYLSAHTEVMKQRLQWFERPRDAFMVLWWVPAGHLPSIDEAKARLEDLRTNGESPRAFTYRKPYPAPDAVDPAVDDLRDAWPST